MGHSIVDVLVNFRVNVAYIDQHAHINTLSYEHMQVCLGRGSIVVIHRLCERSRLFVHVTYETNCLRRIGIDSNVAPSIIVTFKVQFKHRLA